MNKWMGRLLAIITTVVVIAGCTKEFEADLPDTDPGTPGNSKKLSKISYDDGSYMSIQYNAEGKPIKITDLQKSSSGDDTNIYTLTYNGDKLLEMKATDGTKYRYTYTGANVTKVEVLSPNDVVIAYYTYVYQDGRLVRTDAYGSIAGPISNTPTMRFDLAYYSNGNIKSMTTWYQDYTSGVLEKSDVYEIETYDTKRNTSLLFENNPYIPLLLKVPNNPLTEKHYDKAGQQYATLTHTYTYDNQGNPLTRKTVIKETGMADEISTTTFEY
ncbi:MAG: hypothetical protein IBJ16_09845 [Chitinophagaceae bacterium]|nr:hypothetical protein [Chitinophagaceae bacterium]